MIVAVGFAYMVLLVIFTKVHDWIYEIFKLESVGDWFLLFSMQVVALLMHLILYGISQCKYKICCPTKSNRKTDDYDTKEPLLSVN